MSDESPNERAWREWQETQDHRYPLEARVAFDAGTRHGIEFANWQLEDELALAAENARLREALSRHTGCHGAKDAFHPCGLAVQPPEERT